MNADWQEWAAIGVVILTVAIMAWRVFGKRKSSNCGCESNKR
jgi:hypothetical protein